MWTCFQSWPCLHVFGCSETGKSNSWERERECRVGACLKHLSLSNPNDNCAVSLWTGWICEWGVCQPEQIRGLNLIGLFISVDSNLWPCFYFDDLSITHSPHRTGSRQCTRRLRAGLDQHPPPPFHLQILMGSLCLSPMPHSKDLQWKHPHHPLSIWLH